MRITNSLSKYKSAVLKLDCNLQHLPFNQTKRNLPTHSQITNYITFSSHHRDTSNVNTNVPSAFNQNILASKASKFETPFNNYGNFITLGSVTLGAVLYLSLNQKNAKVTCDEPRFIKTAKASFEQLPPYRREGLMEVVKYVGEDRFSINIDERESASVDTYGNRGVLPDVIVFANSTDDVSNILKICNRYDLPVIPYGSGTSLEGNAVPIKGGVIINMSRMRKIKKFSYESSDVTVEPGITWSELNDQIENSGFFFPVDPGPGASIGGMISTRCSGTNAVKYGVMKDWILSLTVVLIDGTIMKFGTRARKDAAGYDIVRLFCGSEGTLGVITEATLKLAPIPQHEYVAISTFPSIKDACDAVLSTTQKGVQIGCAELCDSDSIRAINLGLDKPLTVAPSILYKFTGTKAQVEEAVKLTQQIVKNHGGEKFEYFTPETGSKELWDARKNYVLNYYHSLDENMLLLPTDVCIPIGELPILAEKTKDAFRRIGVHTQLLGHVGDGNFHLVVTYHDDPITKKKVFEQYDIMVQRAIECGGTCTGEHGVGMGKKHFLRNTYSKESIDLMKKIKNVFDPKGLMNPGKVFEYD